MNESPASQHGDFATLGPDRLIEAVEDALGQPMTGLLHALNSYINRVYEMQARDGTRFIAKFYRPGRWEQDALRDEHEFVRACVEAEIPVIPPLELATGSTIGHVDGVSFALYPKRWGRDFEALDEEGWQRLGRILGRLHAVGSHTDATHRIRLHPDHSTAHDLNELLSGGHVTARHRPSFERVAREILDAIRPLFKDVALIRVHGDCHRANILERPGEGLILIDFDDMAMGPAVQDLWMLLPEHAAASQLELDWILEGYRTFCEFDARTLRLIEPLRAMRILYFIRWCSMQISDPVFNRNFPNWGTDAFWGQQTNELYEQLTVIRDHSQIDHPA